MSKNKDDGCCPHCRYCKQCGRGPVRYLWGTYYPVYPWQYEPTWVTTNDLTTTTITATQLPVNTSTVTDRGEQFSYTLTA